MKVAILSESSADEAVIRVLVEGVLGKPTQIVPPPSLKTRGWQGALAAPLVVLRKLHYEMDVDAFVAVVDSDHSPIHQAAHDQPGNEDSKCRLCNLRKNVAKVQNQLRSRVGRPPIKTAFGLAVPTIEAWLRCGVDRRVSEAAWSQGLQSRSFPYTKLELKKGIYGSEYAPLALTTARGIEEAQRLILELDNFEKVFPNGFGSLARAIRNW